MITLSFQGAQKRRTHKIGFDLRGEVFVRRGGKDCTVHRRGHQPSFFNMRTFKDHPSPNFKFHRGLVDDFNEMNRSTKSQRWPKIEHIQESTSLHANAKLIKAEKQAPVSFWEPFHARSNPAASSLLAPLQLSLDSS